MRRASWLGAAAVAAAVAAGMLALHLTNRRPAPQPGAAPGAAAIAPEAPAAGTAGPGGPHAPAPPLPPAALDATAAEIVPRLHVPDATVREDLEVLDELLRLYRRTYGENPVGDNEEIAAALRGANQHQIAYLPERAGMFDAAGRLLDRWGTPYFFHAVAGDRMEIISAGPDRDLHTADDVAGPQ